MVETVVGLTMAVLPMGSKALQLDATVPTSAGFLLPSDGNDRTLVSVSVVTTALTWSGSTASLAEGGPRSGLIQCGNAPPETEGRLKAPVECLSQARAHFYKAVGIYFRQWQKFGKSFPPADEKGNDIRLPALAHFDTFFPWWLLCKRLPIRFNFGDFR
ncbi:MAG TPA: hypothetical protein VHT93_01275 [Pseudolabrys sp.]|nr:hypothetical protein [Pseudolabrys sp.]